MRNTLFHGSRYFAWTVIAVSLGACSKISNTDEKSPQYKSVVSAPPATKPSLRVETVTLRGLPFDGEDVRQKLTDLCKADDKKSGRSDTVLTKYWCVFDHEGFMSLPSFQYGDLAVYGRARVDEKGALLSFSSTAPKGEILGLVDLLTEKYGVPAVTASQIANGVGTKFDKKTLIWTDDPGTKITVESLYDRIDQGRIVIESRSYQTQQQVREKIRRSLYKDKL